MPSAGSLRAGKGFGGVSAHPKRRTRPSSAGLNPDVFDLPSQARQFAVNLYEHKFPSGGYSKVTSVNSSWDNQNRVGRISVSGDLYDKSGSSIGGFGREITWHDRKLVVSHDLLDLYAGKAQGYGSEFNQSTVEAYRKVGVDSVKVSASMTVGGYAWAREGFRMDDGKDPWTGEKVTRHDKVRDMAEIGREKLDRVLASDSSVPYARRQEIVEETNRRATALLAASRAGEDVQPIHIASLGEDDMRFTVEGRETWPGKEMLLGQAWQGTYYFDTKNTAVTAAAALIAAGGYNPNQPRDRTGKWTTGGRSTNAAVMAAAKRGAKKPAADLTAFVRPSGLVAEPSAERKARFAADMAMYTDHPALKPFSRSAIDSAYEARKATQEALDLEYKRTTPLSYNQITVGATYRGRQWMADNPEQFKVEHDRYEQWIKARNDADALVSGKRKPENEVEELFVAKAAEFQASEDPYGRMDFEDAGTVIRFAPTVQPSVISRDSAVASLMDAARRADPKAYTDKGVDQLAEEIVSRAGARVAEEVAQRRAGALAKLTPEDHAAKMQTLLAHVQAEIMPNATLDDVVVMRFGVNEPLSVMVYGAGKDLEREEMPAMKAKLDALRGYTEELGILASKYDQHYAAMSSRVQDEVMRQVLGEARQMGGTAFASVPNHRPPKNGLSTAQHVAYAAERYPKDWIEASNQHESDNYRLNWRQANQRAHYQAQRRDGKTSGSMAEIVLSGELRTTIHEVAHRMEHVVPGLSQVERAFYQRRTAGSPAERMGQGYGRNEVTRPDDFYDRYAGKDYGNGRYYEVLSMGTQQLFRGQEYDRLDDGYKAFVLGALTTLYR